jgi:hypothetical protein
MLQVGAYGCPWLAYLMDFWDFFPDEIENLGTGAGSIPAGGAN